MRKIQTKNGHNFRPFGKAKIEKTYNLQIYWWVCGITGCSHMECKLHNHLEKFGAVSSYKN